MSIVGQLSRVQWVILSHMPRTDKHQAQLKRRSKSSFASEVMFSEPSAGTSAFALCQPHANPRSVLGLVYLHTKVRTLTDKDCSLQRRKRSFFLNKCHFHNTILKYVWGLVNTILHRADM